MESIAEPFIKRKARHLEKGRVVIFASEQATPILQPTQLQF